MQSTYDIKRLQDFRTRHEGFKTCMLFMLWIFGVGTMVLASLGGVVLV